MITRDRRTILILWTVLALLILSAFTAEAMMRNRVCISAATIDVTGVTTLIPEECT